MTRYILRRILTMLVTLWAVSTLTFLLFRLVPGDPTIVLVGPELDAGVAETLRDDFGLDASFWTQYTRFLGNLVQGDLGVSFRYRLPVVDVLTEKLTNTLVLVLPAMVLALGIGILLGSAAAARWRRMLDRVITQTFVAIKSAPSFWLATMALILFSYRLGLLPTGGMVSPGAERSAGWALFTSSDFTLHLMLPLAMTTLLFAIDPLLTTRTAMIENLGEDFVEMSVAKGLSPRRIWYSHVLRNSLLPVVSILPAIAGHLIGGQVIIETVFSWPGMGREIVDAVNNFDYPVMQGTFLAIAALIVVINAATDITYTYLDPRVRLT